MAEESSDITELGRITDGVWRARKVQQFRDGDADGYVGMRGYLNYFQDAAASYMHEYGWGNDTVHERYGVGWVYTKYRMQVRERTAYDLPLSIECWIERNRHLAAVTHDIEIRKDGRMMAVGRLESCLVDVASHRIARLTAVGYDKEKHSIERHCDAPDFSRISGEDAAVLVAGQQSADVAGEVSRGAEEVGVMREAYRYVVRYSDLDNNRHMTNLRYIPLLQDAFTPEEFAGSFISDLEIHYRNQCVYGETLHVCRAKETGDAPTYRLAIVKEDGSVAVAARVAFAV